MSNGYKPVLPSSLMEERQATDFQFQKKISENMYLRLGVVVDIIEDDDENNQSKLVPEYNVMTIENDNTTIYKNCFAVDAFGGIADYFVKKLRKPKDAKKVQESGSLKKQNGSIVLLLCIDGSSDGQGVIISSIAHPDRKSGKLTKALGHHMEGEFNGINWKVDKDGALTVKFKSATDNDGKPADESAGGSTFKMEKDGSMEMADGNKEKIRVDKTKKTIDLAAEKDINVKTEANVNLDAKEKASIKSGADLIADAGGSATFNSAKAFNIKAEAAFELKAKDVKITSDSMVTVKGTQVMINAPQIMVGMGGTPAMTILTQFLGVGNLGMPVLSQAIGPFSSSVFIGS